MVEIVKVRKIRVKTRSQGASLPAKRLFVGQTATPAAKLACNWSIVGQYTVQF
jgi:hypothetical protein